MERTSGITKLVLVLAIAGALNWGLVGFFNFDLVAAIFGGPSHLDRPALSRVIYALVGIAGLALAILSPRLREARGARAALPRGAEAHP